MNPLLASVALAQPFVEEDVEVLWTAKAPGVTFGWAIADVPDTDGDGAPELVTGDPQLGGYSGVTVLLDGRTGEERFRVEGAPGAYEGFAVASAGDQDGDGVADVISGAPGRDAVLVYSGATGERLREVVGDPGEVLGTAVARAGDVDGDGIDELVLGAEGASEGAGRVILLAGGAGGALWEVHGGEGDFLGSAAGTLGDVTGDGVPDVLVGARGHGGAILVLDGRDGAGVHRLTVPGSASLGIYFANGVGDMDGDGASEIYAGDYADVAAGAGAGRAHVWSGATGALRFTFEGAPGDGLGPGRGAGDVDEDGVPDLVIGAYTHSSGATTAGRVTVFSGVDGAVLRTVTAARATEQFGYDAVGMGDVDGDGTVDLAVSAAVGNRVYLVGTIAEDPPATPTTPPPAADDEGCGCRSSGASMGGLAMLVFRRRRRAPTA